MGQGCSQPTATGDAVEDVNVGGLTARMTDSSQNPKNNIILMTDGYKFSHHKQYPVSWMPEHARPAGGGYEPPVLFPGGNGGQATKVYALRPIPGDRAVEKPVYHITLVTNVSTAVVAVSAASAGDAADVTYNGQPFVYSGAKKAECVIALGAAQVAALNLPKEFTKIKFKNVDESKLKRGSPMNDNFEGGYNVSYYTPRAYNEVFEDLTDDNVVIFGLQYFIKEYLLGEVVTDAKIAEADAFIGRYMADVRVIGANFADGFDYTMFPRGDWEAMITGDYDGTGKTDPSRKGKLPIRIESLLEGTTVEPGVCCFKITNTHPRFFWLPNFLETLLVQVWYPMSVATQAREFRKTIQSYGIISQREAFIPEVAGLGPVEFTEKNIVDDLPSVHIAQVFDLLDFGYRGVSSHESASLGSAAYYSAGFEGSDTVAGSRMCLKYYNGQNPVPAGAPPFLATFEGTFSEGHGATSVPAAEHSTITSWADVSPESDHAKYEACELAAFQNMYKQYMPSFAISLVSDGFNIWNAIANIWTNETTPNGGQSMRAMLDERLSKSQLNLVRPDSGEAIETLPQLLTILKLGLPNHWQSELTPLRGIFPASDPYADKYNQVVNKVRRKVGITDGNPWARCVGQGLRVLQGDGVALDTIGDMCASLVSNGFCVNAVHFGSGGGLLQKLNRDSLSVAFKCCSMYVGNKNFPVGKDPIAGGKKSYGGDPPVIRYPDGVLRNRGEYDSSGVMIKGQPKTYQEFAKGVPGDELKNVYENGVLLIDQGFFDIRGRAKITKLEAATKKAIDNLEKKCDFFQTMSAPERIALRLSEASLGSKWSHKHATKLSDILAKYPDYKPHCDKLGITTDMDSHALLKQIKDNHICDKAAKKKVLRCITEGDVDGAVAAMAGKVCLTL